MWFLVGFSCGFVLCFLLLAILAAVITRRQTARKEAADEMVKKANQVLESAKIWAHMDDPEAARDMFLEGLKLSIDAQLLKNKDLQE
jgi:hypothetical protein